MGSDQVASVLRQSGNHVRLIVARCVADPNVPPNPHLPVIPTHMIDEHLHQINGVLAAEAHGHHAEGTETVQVHHVSHHEHVTTHYHYTFDKFYSPFPYITTEYSLKTLVMTIFIRVQVTHFST